MTILEVLKNQLPFIEALLIGVFAHTICGALKHEKLADFDWKALLKGALKFFSILFCIELVMVGINLYEPLFVKYAEEMKVMEEMIVIGVYAKVIICIKEYFEIKEEDVEVVDYNVDKG